MKSAKLKIFLNILLILNLLFSSIAPSFIFAQEVELDPGDGGGSGVEEPPPAAPEAPAPEAPAPPAAPQNPASSDVPVQTEFDSPSSAVTPAQTAPPDVPPEPTPQPDASDAPRPTPPPIATPAPTSQPESTSAPSPTTIPTPQPVTEVDHERDQLAAIANQEKPPESVPSATPVTESSPEPDASSEPQGMSTIDIIRSRQNAASHYTNAADDTPILGSDTQATAITNYDNAAQNAANAADAVTVPQRQGGEGVEVAGVTAAADVVTQVPQAVTDTAGNSVTAVGDFVRTAADGINDLGNGNYSTQVNQRVGEADKEAEQTDRQRQKTLDDYLVLSPQERAQQASQILGLPPGTSPSQVVQHLDQNLGDSGIKLAGDTDDITIIEAPDHQDKALAAINAIFSLPPDQAAARLQQLQQNSAEAVKLAAGFATVGASDVFLDIYKKGTDALNNDLPRLQELRQKAGIDLTSRLDVADVKKLGRMTSEEFDRFVNGEIVNGVVPTGTPEERKAKGEYAQALLTWQEKDDELQQQAKIAGAVWLAGGPLAGEALNAAGRAARPVVQRAGNAALRYLGGLINREGAEVAETGIQVALREGNAVLAPLLAEQGVFAEAVNFGVPSTRRILPTLDSQPAQAVMKATGLAAQVFGSEAPSTELNTLEHQVMTDWVAKGAPADVIQQKANLARQYIQYTRQNPDLSQAPKAVQDIFSTINFEGRLAQRVGSEISPEEAERALILNITDALLSHDYNTARLQGEMNVARDSLTAVRDFTAEHLRGIDPASAQQLKQMNVSQVVDPDRIHLVPSGIMDEIGHSRSTGVQIPRPGGGDLLISEASSHPASTILHECGHDLCFSNNPTYQNTLRTMVGNANSTKLIEGVDEFITRRGLTLSRNSAEGQSGLRIDHIYQAQVEAIDEIVTTIERNAGLTRDTAQAVVMEAGLTGNYQRVVQTLGTNKSLLGRNVDAQKGQSILVDILNRTPDVSSNVVHRDPYVPVNTTNVVSALNNTISALRNRVRRLGENKYEDKTAWRIVGTAYAQTSTGEGKTQLPDFASAMLLTRVNLIKQSFNSTDQVNSDLIKDVVKKTKLTEQVISQGVGYSLSTNENGEVKTKINPGEYLVKVPRYTEVGIVIPETIKVDKGQMVLSVGINLKKGTVKKSSFAYTKSNIPSESKDQGEQPNLQVVTYYDQNGNGKWDKDEKTVPWAGVQVELKKVNQEKIVSLLNGWNLITLTALPAKPTTAATLLEEIAKQGGYAVTVSTLDNGAWKSYVVRGDKTFSGDDFPLEVGKGYFVKALKKSVLVFKGQELVAPVKLAMKSGWNAIGIPYQQKQYKASDFPGDTAARWESGAWDTFVKLVKLNEEYGNNFAVESKRGYVVRVDKNIEFSP